MILLKEGILLLLLCWLNDVNGRCDDTLCPDEITCVWDTSDCPADCEEGQFNCGGQCVRLGDACIPGPEPTPSATPVSCSGSPIKRCGEGSCVYHDEACPVDYSCLGSYQHRCDGECVHVSQDCNHPDSDSGEYDPYDYEPSIGWWRFLGIPVLIVLVIAGAMCRLWMFRSRNQRRAGAAGVLPGGGLAVPAATSGIRPPTGAYPTQNYGAPPPAYPGTGSAAPYPPTSSASQFPPTATAFPAPDASGAYSNPAFPTAGPNVDLPPYPGPQQTPSAPPPAYEEVTKDRRPDQV